MLKKRKIVRTAIFWSIFFTSLSLALGEGLLKDIRIFGDDSQREITLLIEGTYKYKYFELNEPNRLVLDLYGVEIKNHYIKEFHSSYLERIRCEQFQTVPQLVARIVFDLEAKTPYRVSYKNGSLSIIFYKSEAFFSDPLAYYAEVEKTKNKQIASTADGTKKNSSLALSGSEKVENEINEIENFSNNPVSKSIIKDPDSEIRNPDDTNVSYSNETPDDFILEAFQMSKSPKSPSFRKGDYKIGSEDLLEIKVFDIPQFDHTVRVSEDGTISLPLIGLVQTMDLTKKQLEDKIATLLSSYVNNPQVNIFVKEAESKKISVSGAVKMPGIYKMLSKQRLLDMISKAGGFSNEVGKELFVYRNDEVGNRIRIPIDVEKLLYYGEPELNIEITPGDVIFVPLEMFSKIYINGAVKSPGGFDVKKSESITVLQAITMAGGTIERAAEHRTQILRRLPDGKSEIIHVHLKKIKKGKAEDILLKNGDIIYVPEAFF